MSYELWVMSCELCLRVPKERPIYSNGFRSVEKIIQHVQEFRRNDIFIATDFDPLKKSYNTFKSSEGTTYL